MVHSGALFYDQQHKLNKIASDLQKLTIISISAYLL